MAYRIRPGAPPEKEVIRCVRKAIDEAAQKMANCFGIAERIHIARTSCKKARAALQLLKDCESALYTRENSRFRAWARALAPFRDAEVLTKCLSKLLRPEGEESDCRLFASVRHSLQTHRRAIMGDGQSASLELKRFTGRLRKASHRLDAIQLAEISFNSLRKGFIATYRRARHAGRKAWAKQTSTTFHEWRKRIKTHGYQCQLARDLWPAMIKKRGTQITRLGNLLGDCHDLVLLRQFLLCHHDKRDKNGKARIILLERIDARSLYLQNAAEPLGSLLFSEKPHTFKRRLRL